MEKKASDHRRLALGMVVTLVATAVALAPPPAAAQSGVQAKRSPKPEAAAAAAKDCLITDKNGRRWPCSRALPSEGAVLTTFRCDVEDRMANDDYSMFFYCDDSPIEWWVDNGTTMGRTYDSVFDPAPKRRDSGGYLLHGSGEPRVTCEWRYAGNIMSGVVVWDEQWPEAWSCRVGGGDEPCKLVFENKVVTLVAAKGKRVLGDVAIKECSNNWGGYGGWLPFGLGCTYPKHEHPYVGTVVS
uniref:DUF7771 domain-containing protein n=1 Tax=Hordeum vulgare subsp. vulgare TaxID=112509 RepID=A0A8I6Y7J7_HORVV